MDLKTRINVTLAKSVNYIPMGVWDTLKDYAITDLGIPFVKKTDGTAAGFSVYALNVPKATKGSWVASEWKLMESADFLYMVNAYIEKLQAEIITAKYLQSLVIETNNIIINQGAIFKGNRTLVFKKLSESDAVLVDTSYYHRIYELKNDMFLYIGHSEQLNLPISENYVGKEIIIYADDIPVTRTTGDGPSYIYCSNPIVGETVYADWFTQTDTRKITFKAGMIGLICVKQGSEIKWSTIYNTSHVFERTQF